MKTNRFLPLFILIFLALVFTVWGSRHMRTADSAGNPLNSHGMSENSSTKRNNPYYSRTDQSKLKLSDSEWKRILPPDLFEVARHKATERPFTGKYADFTGKGTYYCAACGNELFRSDAKFSSSCGWPSFFEQINSSSVVFEKDYSFGMNRLEALCGRCGSHLGHLFDDGPEPTGKRYCMNSISLEFEPDVLPMHDSGSSRLDTLTLGGGCFWCIEAVYRNLVGVKSVTSGYSGGTISSPTYREVCSGLTGHAEVVQVVYNPSEIQVEEILKVFFTVHDPTTLNRQGADVGTQYRSVIFYHNSKQRDIALELIGSLNSQKVFDQPIVTSVEPAVPFYAAEDYHHQYYELHRNEPYCKLVIQPKLEKFEKYFKDRVKSKGK